MSLEDTKIVLGPLVDSRIWSTLGSLKTIERLVIDTASVLSSLYRLCMRNHYLRQKAANGGKYRPEAHTSTLISYVELADNIKLFLDFLSHSHIEPIFVYEGKQLEAPIYGLLASQFESESIKSSLQIKQVSKNEVDIEKIEPTRLALTIFKSLVNMRRLPGSRNHVFQAFYSSFPLMTKLARDFKCPVLTNERDLIIMDVRAGFILFDELWEKHIKFFSRSNRSRSGSGASQLRKGTSSTEAVGGNLETSNCLSFHFNRLYLKQHPGLNAELAMNLFPLLNREFVSTYSTSLKHLGVFERDHIRSDSTLNSDKILHRSAARVEKVIAFLATKSHDFVANKVRGEAKRTNSNFDRDFRSLFDRYAVAYEFKFHLKKVLTHLQDISQLNYLEWCLINRECSAQFLLSLLTCSIGQMASVSFGGPVHFEDVRTVHSASSMQDRAKALLIVILDPKDTLTDSRSNSVNCGSLTIVQRHKSALADTNLDPKLAGSNLEAIKRRLNLRLLSKFREDKSACEQFMNLVFQCKDLMKLPSHLPSKTVDSLDSVIHNRADLTIVLSILNFTHQQALLGDTYYKTNYAKIKEHLEIAILNLYAFMDSRQDAKRSTSQKSLRDLIDKYSFVQVASSADLLEKPKLSHNKSHDLDHRSSKETSENTKDIGKRVRHLIELLESSIEIYQELNAFLAYPMQKLNLGSLFNPILLYNLTLYSCLFPTNKSLVKF